MAGKKNSQRINENFVKTAPVPSGGRTTFRDDKTPGFQLQVTASGVKSFYFRHADKRKFLGRYPGVKPGEARDQAEILRGQVARGLNPFADSPGRHGGPTLTEFFKDWKARHGVPFRPRTIKQDSHIFEKHIEPALGNVRLINITRAKVQKLHAKIKADAGARKTGDAGPNAGNRTANRMLQLMSIMFNCAREWGLHPGPNPTEGIRRYKENKRERYLTLQEAPQFFKALQNEKVKQDARDLILLALFTGARRGNLFSMSWRDIDFTAALWTVPATEAKTGRAYHIPLVEPALQILIDRHRGAVRGVKFVFPANSESGHLVNFNKNWASFRKLADLENLRFHDLRHSLASWMVQGNVSLAIAGRALGHNSTSTTARYAHLYDAPVRGAMAGAVSAMLQAGGITKIEGGEE